MAVFPKGRGSRAMGEQGHMDPKKGPFKRCQSQQMGALEKDSVPQNTSMSECAKRPDMSKASIELGRLLRQGTSSPD